MDRGASEDVPVLIVGGSLVGLSAALFLRQHGVDVLAVERHAGTAINSRAGHFHLRTVEILRSAGLEDAVRRKSRGAVPAGRRDQQRRVPGRPGDRELLPEPQRRGGRVQPDGAAVHQPGRARADPARPGRRTRRAAALPHRVHVAGAGRGRRHGGHPRPGQRDGEHGAGAVRRRRRREPQPGPGAARHRHERPRPAVAQHHHLLPRADRPRAAAQGPQPGRPLRDEPAAARVLPARPQRQRRLPGGQPGRRHLPPGDHGRLPGRPVGQRGRGDHRAAGARAAAGRHRHPGHRGGHREHRDLAGRGELRGPVPRRAGVPGRRRRARGPAERRVRRQHRRAGRAQPGLEAGAHAGRGGRSRAARQLRRRAAPGRGAHRRAGLHQVRHPGGPLPGDGGHPADRGRLLDGDRVPLQLRRRRARAGPAPAARASPRVRGPAGVARAARLPRPRRQPAVHAGPVRPEFRAAGRAGGRGLAGGGARRG